MNFEIFLISVDQEMIIPEWLFELPIFKPERIEFQLEKCLIRTKWKLFTPKYPHPIKTLERIPNRREQDYFYSYKNAEFAKIPWYQQLFNFISRCLYFMTGPKFVVPILGIVQQKKIQRT